jgi:hypothetical protein
MLWNFDKRHKYKIWSKSFQRDADADRRSDMTQLMVIFRKLLSDSTVNRFGVWFGLLELARVEKYDGSRSARLV